jgi:hypothetical protein
MVGVVLFCGGIDESCDVECVEELVEVCENEQCHEEIFSSIVWGDCFPIILKEFIIIVVPASLCEVSTTLGSRRKPQDV